MIRVQNLCCIPSWHAETIAVSDSLTISVKRLAREFGAAKVGIADVAGLEGPPEADATHVLPTARSVLSFLVVEPEEEILSYLSKKDPRPYRHHFYENIQTLGRIGVALTDLLRRSGYEAVPLSPNGVYEPGSNVVQGLVPPFSHRYAAVAAGLGAIGWSGNVMTPEYGSRVYLSSVVTDAPLRPDSPLDDNPCDRCNICLHACPGRFMSLTESVTFRLGGREITHARKGLHARCAISCGGFTGLSRDGMWSTWSPGPYSIPDDDGELLTLLARLAREAEVRARERPDLPNFLRLSMEVPGYDQPGVLARSELDTATTCGNCAIVCFETLQKRARALKLLRHSGVVVEREDGEPAVMAPEKAREYLAAGERARAAGAVMDQAASSSSS